MTASLPTIEPASPKSRVVLDSGPRTLPVKALRGLGVLAGDLVMAESTERKLLHRIRRSKQVPKACESPTAILDRARMELAEKTDFVFDPAEFPPFAAGLLAADPDHLGEEASIVTDFTADLAISEPDPAPSAPEPPLPPRASTYDTFHPFLHRARARHRHIVLAERAYLVASKDPSTPLAGRLEAAHRASAYHKKRTGLGLCITVAAVLNEGPYAEDFETARLEVLARHWPKWANPSVAEFKPAAVRLAESIGIRLCPDPVTPRSPSPIRRTVSMPHEFGWCLERQSQEMEGVCRGFVERGEGGCYKWEKDPGDLLVPAMVERYWRPCQVGLRPSRLFDQGRRIGNLVASAGRRARGVEASGLGLGEYESGCV